MLSKPRDRCRVGFLHTLPETPGPTLLPGELQGPVHEVTTPEGVPLRFAIASAADRLGAFAVDVVFIALATGVIVGAALLLLLVTGGDTSMPLAVLFLGLFLVRNFYFVWFEVRWHGTTPGKRRLDLRVIDAQGGPVRTEAVFTRNFLREIELFLPAMLVAAPEQVWPGAPGPARLAAIVWALLLALLPLMNRERRRVGDVVAGTIVVIAPKRALLPDLARTQRRGRAAEPVYTFTPEQLGRYGVFELQVLEEILRTDTGPNAATIEAVSRKIRKKIGWPRDQAPDDHRLFLREFYAAQRAHLEKGLLLGRRKEHQHDQ